MHAAWVLVISLAIVCAPSPTITMSASTSSVAIVLYVDANATNWTITIGHLTGFINGLLLTDVCISIKKANGMSGVTADISDLPPDSYLNGVSYHNGGNPNQLNEWDYFLLNKTIYESGSSMVITSSDGKNTFASITIGPGVSPAPPRPSNDYLPIIALISAVSAAGAGTAFYILRRRKATDK